MSTRRLILLAATAVALAACQSTPPPPAPPRPIDFSQRGPIVLNAATIGFADATRPAAGAGAGAGAGPVSPLEAVRLWTTQRLQASGSAGVVRVVVKDASIVEAALPRTQGVKGYFTTDQAVRYDGRLDVEVQAERPGAGGTFRGYTKALATQSTTVPENVSVAGREAALQELTRRLVDDIDARLDAGIRRDLAPMVVR